MTSNLPINSLTFLAESIKCSALKAGGIGFGRRFEEAPDSHLIQTNRVYQSIIENRNRTVALHENASYDSEISQTLKTWDIPLLVCFSDKDAAFKPDEGRAIAESAPNGRFHLIEGAGHFLQEDAGEEIAALMIPFLQDEAKLLDG